ncbi:MAG TPA: hypothetical protein VGX68_23310 [Thermoanaerobaculia bacterium]|jgi:hypothetical protein|nr:hypothetical protein [Thermoanaerobaculia bacterium]
MRRRLILTAFTAFALAVPLWAAPPQAAAVPQLIDLRVNPLIDLHYWVRKLASQQGELPAVVGLPEAVTAVRRGGAALGDLGLWGVVDGSFTEASTAAELARVATEVPESFTTRDGRSIPVRQILTDLAAAYGRLEKSFLASVWPGHREIAERAGAALRQQLLPKAPEVYADISRHLGVPVPPQPLPVYLVAAAPFPGAFTYRSQEGPFSVVALEGEPGSAWVEIVIHETIHALDVHAGEGSVLAELRSRLGKVPGASPKEVHDFVHTVMFAQAAGTVRRVLQPNHKDYGDAAGYYLKVPRAAAVVVPAWRDYLEGKLNREAVVEKIVKGFAEGLAKEKGGSQAAPVKPPEGKDRS